MRRQKPVFSICAEHLLHLRAVHVRGAAGRSRPCHLNFTDATKGSAFGLQAGQAPFFWQKEEAFL